MEYPKKGKEWEAYSKEFFTRLQPLLDEFEITEYLLLGGNAKKDENLGDEAGGYLCGIQGEPPVIIATLIDWFENDPRGMTILGSYLTLRIDRIGKKHLLQKFEELLNLVENMEPIDGEIN